MMGDFTHDGASEKVHLCLVGREGLTLNQIIVRTDLDADSVLKALSYISAFQINNKWYVHDVIPTEIELIEPEVKNRPDTNDRYKVQVKPVLLKLLKETEALKNGLTISEMIEKCDLGLERITKGIHNLIKGGIEIEKIRKGGTVSYRLINAEEDVQAKNIQSKKNFRNISHSTNYMYG